MDKQTQSFCQWRHRGRATSLPLVGTVMDFQHNFRTTACHPSPLRGSQVHNSIGKGYAPKIPHRSLTHLPPPTSTSACHNDHLLPLLDCNGFGDEQFRTNEESPDPLVPLSLWQQKPSKCSHLLISPLASLPVSHTKHLLLHCA